MQQNFFIGEKKVGEKWLNFLHVTKFFPDFLFPDQYFSPIFYTWQRIYPDFFSNIIIVIILILIISIISSLFAKFIITMFFLMYFIYRGWSKQF